MESCPSGWGKIKRKGGERVTIDPSWFMFNGSWPCGHPPKDFRRVFIPSRRDSYLFLRFLPAVARTPGAFVKGPWGAAVV